MLYDLDALSRVGTLSDVQPRLVFMMMILDVS